MEIRQIENILFSMDMCDDRDVDDAISIQEEVFAFLKSKGYLICKEFNSRKQVDFFRVYKEVRNEQ